MVNSELLFCSSIFLVFFFFYRMDICLMVYDRIIIGKKVMVKFLVKLILNVIIVNIEIIKIMVMIMVEICVISKRLSLER